MAFLLKQRFKTLGLSVTKEEALLEECNVIL